MHDLNIRINLIKPGSRGESELTISIESPDGGIWYSLEEFLRENPDLGEGKRSWNGVTCSGQIPLPLRHSEFFLKSRDGAWFRLTYLDDLGREKMLVVGGKHGTRKLSCEDKGVGYALYKFSCYGDNVEDVVKLLDVE